jgi:hypothetical protein
MWLAPLDLLQPPNRFQTTVHSRIYPYGVTLRPAHCLDINKAISSSPSSFICSHYPCPCPRHSRPSFTMAAGATYINGGRQRGKNDQEKVAA